MLTSNAAARLGQFLGHRSDPRARVHVLTESEVGAVLQAAERWYPEHRELVGVFFFTGLREGEAFGLQSGDLVLDVNYM